MAFTEERDVLAAVPLLPELDPCDSVTAVSDASRQWDAGASVETTSGAPVGCWANEATPKTDELDASEAEETVPVGCWADQTRLIEAESVDDGDLSVNAPGGQSDNSSKEPETAADSIKSQRDFELFLRASGFSRTAAKSLASGGWPSVSNAIAEPVEELDAEFSAQLHGLMQLFK